MSDPSSDGFGSIPVGPPSVSAPDMDSSEQELYVAVLVLESSSEEAGHTPLYEESFTLVKATTEDEAREKAVEYGKAQEASYHNENDQLITWKLKQVVDVAPVEDATFDDGSELYSRFFRNYESYRGFELLRNTDDV